MSTPNMSEARPLPGWLMLAGSALIVAHLLAVIIVVIAARSGPWPSPFGPTPQEPPPFASTINEVTIRYLEAVHLAHDYHFSSNKPDYSAVRFEVRLKDAEGHEIKTVRFPEDNANFWVRQRQALLAQNLGDDQPVQVNKQNVVPAPGQEPDRVKIWDRGDAKREFVLKSVPASTISRDRPVNAPSRWSQLLAQSYIRFLKREYQAQSAELVRHSREAIPPVVLFMPQDQWPPDLFEEMVAEFPEEVQP